MQTEGSAKFDMLLQKVSCLIAVKLLDLFIDSMEVVSSKFVHGNACSHSVMTTK